MSKNIVFEGWLTKSPPSKRIWRTKWRRRWFALRQSGELPGQYFLDYYADRNCRRLKGTINLDLCEQVDAGLHMERTGNGNLDPKLRGSVFTIQTQSRTYHLEADCEADMEKWVDAICRVCGLRATDESSEGTGTFPSNLDPIPTITREPTPLDSTGPYIPISECITGVRAQDSQRAFTFDPKNIITSMNSQNQLYTSQPQVRLANPELSDNDSNPSDEECKSLNNSQHNIRDYSVAKTFTKMNLNESPHKNGESEDGPPVPPRPPKTLGMSKEKCQKEPLSTSKSPEKLEAQDQNMSLRVPRRLSQVGATPPSPVKALVSATAMRVTPDDEDDIPCPQYWNLSMPPAVDRALKPRSSSYSIGSPSIPMTQAPPLPPRAPVKSILKNTQQNQLIQETSFTENNDDVPLPLPPRCPVVRFTLKITPPDDAVEVPKELPLPLPPRAPRVRPVVQEAPPAVLIKTGCFCNVVSRTAHFTSSDEIRPDTLQYLDLDLTPQSDSKDGIKKPRDIRRKVEIAHGKSFSAADAECAYKTVDFLKTEAFNITRKDAEASRNNY